ncbi:MAG: lipase [Nocardia sp.]|uniref:esterase/lipase family protein n=1 Tax=Nocardia sp. TaxID=1821 RepID=UPI0026222C9E|nr:alpha/beta fold hydrolase [Nocardia sp.]MCU1647661.1 lipase [Nocardia sp.]
MSVRSHCGALVVFVVCVCLALLGPVAASAEPAIGPVQDNWSAALAYSVLNPAAVPQGINDFSCTPAVAHPNPVVLVNGAFESMYVNWSMLAPLLRSEGYCVFGLDYGTVGGLHQVGPLRESAREVGAFVDRVRSATGAAKVDLVAHSEGGLVGLYFINQLGGSDKVATMVGLAPITNGISAYGLLNAIATNPAVRDAVGAVIPAVADGTSGSAFVRETGMSGMTRPGVTYLTVSSRTDLIVAVGESQLPAGPGVTDAVVQDSCAADLTDHK